VNGQLFFGLNPTRGSHLVRYTGNRDPVDRYGIFSAILDYLNKLTAAELTSYYTVTTGAISAAVALEHYWLFRDGGGQKINARI
jgi:hypothetical protein